MSKIIIAIDVLGIFTVSLAFIVEFFHIRGEFLGDLARAFFKVARVKESSRTNYWANRILLASTILWVYPAWILAYFQSPIGYAALGALMLADVVLSHWFWTFVLKEDIPGSTDGPFYVGAALILQVVFLGSISLSEVLFWAAVGSAPFVLLWIALCLARVFARSIK